MSRIRLALLGAFAFLSVVVAGSCTVEEPLGPSAAGEGVEFGTAASSRQTAASQHIPNQYIIVFRDDVRDPPGLARGLARSYGLGVRHVYRHTIKGFAARIPEASRGQVLDALRNNPRVRYVEQDQLWTIDGGGAASVAEEMGTELAAVPAAPSDVAVTVVSSTEIGLSWTDNSSDERSFEIRRCEGAGCTGFAKVGSVRKNVTTFTDTGLTGGTEYCYEVLAVAGKGKSATYSAPAGPACATTTGSVTSSRFVEDLLEDAGGVPLQSHVGQTGATWTRHDSSQWDALFRANGSEIYSDVEAVYYASGVPPGADYRVAAKLHVYTETDFLVRYVFVAGRMDETAKTMYQFGFVYANVNRWELKKIIGGTETLLGFSTSALPVVGDEPLVDLRMEGTSIRGFVDGVEVVSVVDGEIAGPGKAGLRMLGGDGSNASMLEIEATTLDLAPPPPPADNRPTDLAATAISESEISLSWTDNSDNETGFEVERCEGAGCTGFVNVGTVGADVTTFTDMGLTGGTEYCYRVRGVRSKGRKTTQTEYSNVDCATTLAPPPSPPPPPLTDPPTGLVASASSSSSVGLSWTDNSDEESFEVERCEGAGCTGFVNVGTVGADVTTFTDMGLTGGTEYCYRVRGVVQGTPTGYSNVDCATAVDVLPPGACPDTGNHDDLTQLWDITRIRADQSVKWQGTQNGGECEMHAWFFGLDSGVDSDHPDLNVVETMEFVGDGSGGEDGNGHGTHTAGTAAARDGNGGSVGVAPGAKVYGFKVCNDDGSCPLSAIIAGVDEVTARKSANTAQPMVANMSLGGDVSEAIDEAVRRSVNAGIVYALAAGNGLLGACLIPNDAQNFSPARIGDDDITSTGGTAGDTKKINGAIATTSSNQSDADDNCNFGAPVTVASPGTQIYSTWLNGGYNTISGTSMATPHTAGAAILYLQDHPAATPEEVEAAILGLLDPWTTDDLPNAGGRLNVGDL